MKRAPKGLVYTILVDGKPIVTLEASTGRLPSFARKNGFGPNCLR